MIKDALRSHGMEYPLVLQSYLIVISGRSIQII